MIFFIEWGLPAICSFVFGLIVGSFLNVCIYRIPLDITVVNGRSFCPDCKNPLRWYDLIPVLSFLFLRGKCRNCKGKISPRYPAIELLNAVLWFSCFLVFGFTFKALLSSLCLSALIVAAMIDFDTGFIPDRISVFIALLAVLSLFVEGFPTPLDRAIGAVCVSLPMLVAAIWKNGFGGGDIKLVAAFGLLMGWQLSLVTILFASVTGCIWAVILLVRKKAERTSTFAFGPFLAGSMAISILWGERLLQWYLSLFML